MSSIVRVTPRVTAPPGFPPDKGGLHRGGSSTFHGAGEENLLRDAAMNTDSDGDGVVDGFSVGRRDTGWTPSLNTSEGAQEWTASGGGADDDEFWQVQRVLRVFGGDQLTLSFEGKVTTADLDWTIFFRFLESDGTAITFDGGARQTNTSYARVNHTATAPANSSYCWAFVRGTYRTDGVTGDVRFRNARLLRASSDPATYANPHVSGSSQTGSTLVTAGWPASTQVLRKGDAFLVGGSGATEAGADAFSRIHRAASDVSSDGSGDASIPLGRPLLSSPADGAALRFDPAR